jgi:enolase
MEQDSITMSSSIVSTVGRRVWDSRARPTIEVEITLADGTVARAIAPAGASTGSGEAVDRRDGGDSFGGLDVRHAIASVNGEIAKALHGRDAHDQTGIDALLIKLDGTPNKARLGGNSMIATSMAVLHAAALSSKKPLWHYLAGDGPVSIPVPEIQIFGGGAHAARRVDIQDFMVICPTAGSFAEALDRTAEVYRAAGGLLKARGLLQGVADEGGFWPAFESNEEALDMLVKAIEAAHFQPGTDVSISLDVAASEFGAKGRYRLARDGREIDTEGMIQLLSGWIDRFPIISVEDPVAEDDAAGFKAFVAREGKRVQVIGDDFLVTDAARVERSAADKSCTAVLIKPNQAGTIFETKAALDAGKRNGFGTIVSARSGETEDTTIAHLAVGWNAGQFKVGSISRGERTAKWNEMLRIEAHLGAKARFAGDALVYAR